MHSPSLSSLPSPSFFAPVLCAGAKDFALLSGDGEIRILGKDRAFLMTSTPLLVCHAPYMRARLKCDDLQALDVLELYSFVHPTRFCVPTPAGLAKALGLSPPVELEDMPGSLLDSARVLLEDLRQNPKPDKLLDIAAAMGLNGRGWGWTSWIFSALGKTYDPKETIISKTLFNVWAKLPEWADEPPPPPPAHFGISGEEVREKLESTLQHRHRSEVRPAQMNYATRLTEAFQPRGAEDDPVVVLAEAGTGVGKTLGYLTPAALWSEKNDGSVWISTYTKNLQRQINNEVRSLFPDPDLRAAKVAIRKGRENYLCLLNFEDVAAAAGLAKHIEPAISTGLMARWVMETEDGDLSGPDFSGWLPSLLGFSGTLGLADRRGECIFSGCDHYHRCFSERAIRKAARSPLVISNHAVMMIKAAHADDDLPRHTVFDEGHHVFDAADSAFAAHLTGQESYDLRRWLIGPEGGRKSRARGLSKRLEDLIAADQDGLRLLEDVLHRARFLPTHDWLKRLKQGGIQGSAELFFEMILKQVWARAEGRQGPYSLETGVFPLLDGVGEAAIHLRNDLKALRSPMLRLSALLKEKLSTQAETLSSDHRKRIESVALSLDRRINSSLAPWIAMLSNIEDGEINPEFVDWMEIERNDGQATDVGLYRHYVDPVKTFAQALKPHAHSVVITSATLRDTSDSEDSTASWESAKIFTGATSFTDTPAAFSIPSPFDYAEHTRVIVVTDIRRDDMDQLGAAYRTLFEAAGGGALGLFTAIQRLRAVHSRIQGPLAAQGITLYGQHADGIDTGTLVDMFRDDTHSCLLGTDAVRDGVDVPGESLRLIVFDRVPWPRSTLLHKARREAFGKGLYDDRLTRLRLKQAYGRLIRQKEDRGIFVILDSAAPSRLMNAFPDGVEIHRVGLAEALKITKDFLCIASYS